MEPGCFFDFERFGFHTASAMGLESELLLNDVHGRLIRSKLLLGPSEAPEKLLREYIICLRQSRSRLA